MALYLQGKTSLIAVILDQPKDQDQKSAVIIHVDSMYPCYDGIKWPFISVGFPPKFIIPV